MPDRNELNAGTSATVDMSVPPSCGRGGRALPFEHDSRMVQYQRRSAQMSGSNAQFGDRTDERKF